MLPPDNHVHSEFSWDTGPRASLLRACERAVEVGLPAIAFTEHLDFTVWDPFVVAGQGWALSALGSNRSS